MTDVEALIAEAERELHAVVSEKFKELRAAARR